MPMLEKLGGMNTGAPLFAPQPTGRPAAGLGAPMMAPMAIQSPLTASPMLDAPGMMNPTAGAPSPQGGLMGLLGLNQQQAGALPGLMSMMGQGLQSLGGGQQAPQAAPQIAPAGNNPAAIQAAIQMMRRLGGSQPDLRTPRPFGGFPQGLPGQFPGTRDRGGIMNPGF